ncbi:MAG: hypothetical protein ABI411_05945 [Tahibacter sp.]
MASFPKIDSPCPIRWNAMPTAERNFCTQCERKVHNLDALSATQRREFLAGCSGSVCVAYTVAVPRSRLGSRLGLGMAAALALSPALAEPPATTLQSPVQSASLTPKPEFVDCDHAKDESTDKIESIVITGGTVNGGDVRWVDEDEAISVLPEIAADAFLDGSASAEFVAAPTTTSAPR